ncbi:MAG: hypothetical protein HYT16_03790 [DPANN group archaeon]|nr:hypothetical protein [DPANN group archaeon]
MAKLNLGIWLLAAIVVFGVVAVVGSDATGALTLIKKGSGSGSSFGGSGLAGGCYSNSDCPANYHCEFTSGGKGRCAQNAASTCTDTDGGSDTSKQGTCTDSKGSYTDVCRGAETGTGQLMYEQACSSYGNCTATQVDCAALNKACQNGACV